MKKIERVYTVYVEEIILKSSQIDDKFTVFMFAQENVVNSQEWYPKFYYKSKLSKTTQLGALKEKFMISKYHVFHFDAKQPQSVIASQYIDGLVEFTFDLRITNQFTLASLASQKLYTGPIPIAKKKMDDLKKMKNYIPEASAGFWRDRYDWPEI
ncbi:unnamed protein product [Pieris brassicae]|uniref:Uncharacterized protein n=1 Tax=Pieris brassicae TaxID=7116 RepID=A0A9P0TEH9_PIEBR|nr:unnamed protein product [Pieris brassicae]